MKKNKKIAALLMLAAATSAIPAAEIFPIKRVLTPAGMKVVGQTPVIVAEINNGIEKRWSRVGLSAGYAETHPNSKLPMKGDFAFRGELAVIDAIQNAAPLRRAQSAASEVAELLPASAVQRSLLRHLQAAASTEGTPNLVSLGPVSTVQKVLDPWPNKDALEISASYMLAEDASAFRAVFQVSYTSSKLNYTTPYSDKKVPKSERTGPIYRNTFVYRSARLPVPALIFLDHPQLIAAIEESYRDEQGQLPAPDSDDSRKMAKEIQAANDDEFTNDELAVILTRQWLADDGKLLKSQLEDAHAFFVKYLVQDLNSTDLPKPDRQELESAPGAWIVQQLGSGSLWGYEHIPVAVGGITQDASYGDSTAISKAQQHKVVVLKRRAERAKK